MSSKNTNNVIDCIPRTDETRITAYEKFMEISVSRYAVIAIQKELERLQTLAELLKKRAEEEQSTIAENERELDKLLSELREHYNIPSDYLIDVKTGKVAPPKE